MKISNLLLEGLILYKIDILIKTSIEENQVFIYNEIRGLKGVVVVTVKQNDFLKSKSDEKHQYALLKTKFLSGGDPRETINNIKKDALITNKIKGLYQFIPRFQTIQKIGQY